MELTLTAAADDDGRRLDRILRKALRDLPLSAIHRLLRQGCIRVNGKAAGAARRIQTGETIIVDDRSFASPSRLLCEKNPAIPPKSPRPGTKTLAILFEGSGLLVVNKPAGLEVHGAPGCGKHLAGQVLSYLEPKLPPSLSFRPGPLHRLDKPSSGAIAFSASLEGARLFSALMRERKIKKYYLALAEGSVGETELWQDELIRDGNLKKTFAGSGDGAKTALTRVRALARNAACTLILAEIETGRSHQIRAQAAARGHPLLGDKKYGARPFPGGCAESAFLLHAWRMEFPAGLPSPALPALIEAPLPAYFSEKIRELFGEGALDRQVLTFGAV